MHYDCFWSTFTHCCFKCDVRSLTVVIWRKKKEYQIGENCHIDDGIVMMPMLSTQNHSSNERLSIEFREMEQLKCKHVYETWQYKSSSVWLTLTRQWNKQQSCYYYILYTILIFTDDSESEKSIARFPWQSLHAIVCSVDKHWIQMNTRV